MELKGLLMIGAVLIGGFFALSGLKGGKIDFPVASASSVNLSGPTRAQRDKATRAQGAAEDHVIKGYSGEVASGPIFAHDRSKAVFIADALQDWRPASEREVFGKVQLIAPVKGCDMPAPAAGSRVVNFFVNSHNQEVGMYSFSQSEVVSSAKKWLANIRRGEAENVPRWRVSPQFHAFDVVVTETREPVHLVLQSRTEGVMQSLAQSLVFNLHLAEGAQVSGVSIIGGRANAVANIDPSVPIAVMPDDALERCGIVMATRDVGDRLIKKDQRDGKLSRDKDLKQARRALLQKVEAYNIWFAQQFGKRSDATVYGVNLARGALAGPVPKTPEQAVPYRPLTGAYIAAQTLDHIKVAGLHKWPDAYQDEVVKLTTWAAGGNPVAISRPRFQIMEFLR